ncbi:AMP-binding protein [Bdellovibrio sp. HCB337]|uniref:AMP-binding protein n=1 Tax=Bdellovibrio sp. HCB337 TaxID=3394358 RepID=UPI0039A4112F
MDASEDSLNPVTIDWQNDENHILLNPRWSEKDSAGLCKVAQTITQRRNLQGHLWLATSGSTSEAVGQIKLVALSKKAFQVSALAVNKHLQANSSDVWLQVLPRFHVGGLGVEVRAHLSGSRVVCDFEKWNPERIHKNLSDNKITIASMVPTQVFDLVQAGLQSPKSLRAVIVGGGALTEGLYQQARKLNWPLLPSYGMTETCSQIATASLESLQSSAMPLPQKLSHVEWRADTEGLLQVRGESLLTCYGQRQKDGKIVDWDPKIDGWFPTEDFVKLQDLSIRFTGRKNDFIKIGGESSSMGRLREIFERVVAAVDSSVSQQVALVDAPSERLATEIHLVTSLQGKDQLLSQLEDNFNQEVLPFERIREVKYITGIPRSDLGKVLWAQMKRELYGR